MRTILLTGFGIFGEHSDNPTTHIVSAMDGRHIEGVAIKGLVLPVEFDEAPVQVMEWVEKNGLPDALVMLGMAAGRQEITPERVAINWGEGKTRRAVRSPGKLLEEGPDGLFSRLPNEAFVKRLMKEGWGARMSNTAGTYVCNALMYHVLYNWPSLAAGFIHVPPHVGATKEQTRWTLPDLERAVEQILSETIRSSIS
ncbi:peptidase C15 [Aureibacillus halotolerans]|uniref:Pyroglutamyl-peptidase I n=1 Tax=Aureibacillus halotolerans TaxID=1508390 RepID=A0A4R6TXU3_9BACI|nr:peptidase C15 [Aureibacillus halotolerans]TDQ38718.1 pyroglutamyl-peptidase [Aureibacillus halotolerans]